MLDVHIPTTDGRELELTRYTASERELELLLARLNLELPVQTTAENYRPAGRHRHPPASDFFTRARLSPTH